MQTRRAAWNACQTDRVPCASIPALHCFPALTGTHEWYASA